MPLNPPTVPPNAIAIADARLETWPLARPFVISRGAKTEARVLVVEVTALGMTGRGEAVPYARYAETPEAALAMLRKPWPLERSALQTAMPPGAARNALDCALWDLEAKITGQPAASLAGVPPPIPVETCFTISLATPAEMAAEAIRAGHLNLLKLKLGGAGDADRMAAVRDARPDCRLVADANEAWDPAEVSWLLDCAATLQFEVIEQPLPAGNDALLAQIPRPVPVCADESAHTSADLRALRDRYDAVNIKLDKAGGLTEALAMRQIARDIGFEIMIGSMVATSLAAAPALLLTDGARWVDLDGPLLLASDRPEGLLITDGWIATPPAGLWG